MKISERKQHILKTLQEKGSVDIAELADQLEVSSMTVRRDLKALAVNGAVTIEQGTAVLNDGALREYDLLFNHGVNVEQKRRIASYCAGLVSEGDSVFLDAGTTVKEIALELRGKRNVNLLTDSMLAANAVAGLKHSKLIMCPGEYRELSAAFLGPLMDDFVRNFQIDVLFLSTEGIDLDGVSVVDVIDGHSKRVLIEQARKVVCVADSSKFGKSLFYNVAPLDKINLVVTDSGLGDDEFDAMVQAGIAIERV